MSAEQNMSQEEIIKKQMENCIFCKLASKEIPTHIVQEDENFMAVLDMYPASKGHVVIFPKKHIPVTPLMDQNDMLKLATFIQLVGSKVIGGLAKGYSVFIANGAIAGQKSPHLIIHVIPRYESDNILLNPQISKKEGYDQIHKKIVEKIGGDINSPILMEDDDLIIMHPQENFVNGQIKIVVKNKGIILESIPTDLFGKIMQIVNKMAALMFDKLESPGTNVLIQNGEPAGQTENVFSVNLIPRFPNDNLKLEWQPKEANPAELKEIIKGFKEIDQIQAEKLYQKQKEQEIQSKTKKQNDEDKDIVKEKESDESENKQEPKINHLYRSINRLP